VRERDEAGAHHEAGSAVTLPYEPRPRRASRTRVRHAGRQLSERVRSRWAYRGRRGAPGGGGGEVEAEWYKLRRVKQPAGTTRPGVQTPAFVAPPEGAPRAPSGMVHATHITQKKTKKNQKPKTNQKKKNKQKKKKHQNKQTKHKKQQTSPGRFRVPAPRPLQAATW